MILHALGADRLKRAQADVQSDGRNFGAGLTALAQDFRREVQARGGRGHGTGMGGEDGLVALAVERLVGALDVRRQGHVADAAELLEEVAGVMEAQGALAEGAATGDFGLQLAIEADALADAHLAAGMHQRLPGGGVAGVRTNQEDFHFALQILAAGGVLLPDGEGVHAGAMPVEAGWENFGIVEHQAVAGPQELRQIAEGGVLPAPLVAEEHQHARGGAVLQRALCDQLLGQGIIEVG